MWNQVDKLLHPKPARAPETVRQPSMNLGALAPGSVLRFAASCPLPELAGQKAAVQAVRTYCFDTDVTVSYTLDLAGRVFALTVAEDKQGYYLSIARELSSNEQDQFFGRDALGFFTEQSTAKTIRCKADLSAEGSWAAPRYSKIVDWMEGSMTQGRLSTIGAGRQTRHFHYNQLLDESGEKSLEIEHYEDGAGENKIYLAVYRPVEDIVSLAEPMPHIPVPTPRAEAKPVVAEAPPVRVKPIPQIPLGNDDDEEELLLSPEGIRSVRTDFRRLHEDAPEEIHIGRTKTPDRPQQQTNGDIPPLPSFLLNRENNYLSLDDILTPEAEHVRCDLTTAKILIDTALKRRVRVRDILRDLIGLDTQMQDETVFELPLTEGDYRALAQRYRLRPDHRAEIRARLQEDLRQRLLSIAKN